MKTGDRVVFVEQTHPNWGNAPILVKGEIYRISVFYPNGYISLVEIGDDDWVYRHEGFRPVVDIGDEVEQYISEKVEADQMIEV